MEYITLKNSEIEVSRLCMGGCPMGGYGWGTVQEDELIAAVYTALDLGVTFFDTADTYGLGQSEITLGKALGKRRKDVVVASKFGVRVGGGKTIYDNSPAWIRKALEESLRRLGTDYIDLYQVHYRDGVTPISEVVETLEELKQKGYIRSFGLSNIHRDEMTELSSYAGKFVSFTPYVVLSVTALIPKYYFENHSFEGFLNYFVKAVFAPRIGVWGHFWFLPVLLLVYAVFGLWKMLFRKNETRLFFVVATVISIILYFLPYSTEWLGLGDFKEAVIYFILGIFINVGIDKKSNHISMPMKGAWIVVGTTISVLFVHFCYENKAVMLITGILMISVCWNLAELIGENRVCKWFSTNNFTIYIYSWPFQTVMMVIAERLGLNWYLTSVSMFIVGMMMPILLILIYKKLKVINNRFFDLVIGIK